MLLTARTSPFVLFWWSSPSDHSGKIVFNPWANSCAGEELQAIPSVSWSFGNRPHGAGASLRGIWHQASVGTGSRTEYVYSRRQMGSLGSSEAKKEKRNKKTSWFGRPPSKTSFCPPKRQLADCHRSRVMFLRKHGHEAIMLSS